MTLNNTRPHTPTEVQSCFHRLASLDANHERVWDACGLRVTDQPVAFHHICPLDFSRKGCRSQACKILKKSCDSVVIYRMPEKTNLNVFF